MDIRKLLNISFSLKSKIQSEREDVKALSDNETFSAKIFVEFNSNDCIGLCLGSSIDIDLFAILLNNDNIFLSKKDVIFYNNSNPQNPVSLAEDDFSSFSDRDFVTDTIVIKFGELPYYVSEISIIASVYDKIKSLKENGELLIFKWESGNLYTEKKPLRIYNKSFVGEILKIKKCHEKWIMTNSNIDFSSLDEVIHSYSD